MSGGKFGFGEVNEYYPEYEGIDWYDAYTARFGRHDPPAWFESNDELGELVMQLHQENMAFYLNRTNPDLDSLAVTDPRDGNAIWWTRGSIGNEEFETLLKNFFNEATVVSTKYPMRSVAQYAIGFAQSDITTTESFPEDWTNK